MRILLVGANPECDYNPATLYIQSYLQNDEKIRDHCHVDNLTYRMKSYYDEIVSCMAHLGNPNLNLFINRMCKDIIDSGADLCGWSCYIWNVDLFMRVIGALKKLKPSIKHVLGGPEFFSHQLEKTLRRYPAVDFIIHGEGEITLKELIYYHLDRSLPLDKIQGLAYLTPEGNYIQNPPRPALRDMSEIPSPFLNGVWKSQINTVMIETYRGCPYDCYFCLYGKMMGQSIRYF
jgi:anaerobic magnesium-protoporphyrin IX monomethyl ester cyclase